MAQKQAIHDCINLAFESRSYRIEPAIIAPSINSLDWMLQPAGVWHGQLITTSQGSVPGATLDHSQWLDIVNMTLYAFTPPRAPMATVILMTHTCDTGDTLPHAATPDRPIYQRYRNDRCCQYHPMVMRNPINCELWRTTGRITTRMKNLDTCR